MKSKILALILAVLMITPILASCGDEVMTIIDSHPNAITLTLYSITNKSTTPEGIKAAQDALNEVMEAEFDVHLELCFYTEDEYMDVIHKKMDNLEKLDADGFFNNLIVNDETDEDEEDAENTEETTAETESNETKRRGSVNEEMEFVYPDAEDYQMDIFLLTSLDDLNEAVSRNMVVGLDNYIGGAYHILNKYISPNFTDSYKAVSGGTHAVANNRAIGDYEYILINKNVASGYDISSIASLSAFQAFLNDAGGTAVETYDVTPQASSILDDPSLIGAYTGRDISEDMNAMPRNLLSVPGYTDDMNILHTLRSSGSLTKVDKVDPSNTSITAAFVKGGPEIEELYKDNFYTAVYKYPVANNDEVFGSMYCVGRYTQSISQCMDVIRFLTIDPVSRNILQYGAEGVNFEFDEEDKEFVHILNDDYSMDPKYTGNEFIMYQNDKMSEAELAFSANNWALAKKQNLAALKDPYLTFSPKTTEVIIEDTNKQEMNDDYDTVMDNVADISEDYLEKITETGYNSYVAANGTISYTDYLSKLSGEIDENRFFKQAVSSRYSNSPYTKYLSWYKYTKNAQTTEEG